MKFLSFTAGYKGSAELKEFEDPIRVHLLLLMVGGQASLSLWLSGSSRYGENSCLRFLFSSESSRFLSLPNMTTSI